MPVITGIKPQRSKKRVNIYLDGKFGFGLDLENFVKLGLKTEQYLSEDEVEELVGKSEYQKTYDKLVRFATIRPRSEKEVKNWFIRRKVHESIQKELFNQLKRLELLDDEKFARWWMDQRMSFRPRSKRMLRYELLQKGIDKDTIENALSEVEIDEVKVARELVMKKRYKWERLEDQVARKKKSEFLARKGFSWEVIKQVV